MFKWLKRNNKKKGVPPVEFEPQHIQEDEIELEVEDITIKLRRKLNLRVPHEITVVIPRVELRDRYYENGELTHEDEKIYNSITVVHAPMHPLENPPGFGGPLPPPDQLIPPTTGGKLKPPPPKKKPLR